MDEVNAALDLAVGKLSDENYAQSLDFYRFWFSIGEAYYQIPPDQIFNVVWTNRATGSGMDWSRGKLIHEAAHLILRFASDAESDGILGPYSSGLQRRLSERSLREFFRCNLGEARGGWWSSGLDLYTDANLIAHWANLGYVEEIAIRGHILQSLISYPTLYDHQAYTLMILFKLAGATFEAYADPPVVDRCFELLKDHYIYDPGRDRYDPRREELERLKQARALRGGG